MIPDRDKRKITERVREAGLRVTRPRLAVLALLFKMGGHRSAEDLIRELRTQGSTLPRASVYNVLNDLARVGMVMQADAGPGRTLYEAATHWHHHFVCRECGHVLDVPCIVGAKPCLEPGLAGLHADEAQVIFRGPCPYAGGATTDLPDRPPCCLHRPPTGTTQLPV